MAQITVINTLGQMIFQGEVVGERNIDVSNWPMGVYHCILKEAANDVVKFSIVKTQ
jgi:hypothetical protein